MVNIMKIFISYSSSNRAEVELLALDLRSAGHSVWFDQELSGAREWWEDILSNIRECDLFLFALSPASLQSSPCRLEYEYADSLKKNILPIIIHTVDLSALPHALQKLQVIDFREADKSQTLTLIKALNNLPATLSMPEPLPKEPPIPVSPLLLLKEELEINSLNKEKQRLIIGELEDYLADKATYTEAIRLLRRMLEHPDLLASSARRIEQILGITSYHNPVSKPISLIEVHKNRTLINNISLNELISIDNEDEILGISKDSDYLYIERTKNNDIGNLFKDTNSTDMANSNYHRVEVYQLSTQKLIKFLKYDEIYRGAYLNNLNNFAIIKENETHKIISLHDESFEYTIPTQFLRHGWYIHLLPDNRTIVILSFIDEKDKKHNNVVLYDLVTDQVIFEFQIFMRLKESLRYYDVSPDQTTMLLKRKEGGLELVSLITGQFLYSPSQFRKDTLFGETGKVTYFPDSKHILIPARALDFDLAILDIPNQSIISQINISSLLANHISRYHVVLSSDGKLIACAVKVNIVKANTWKLLIFSTSTSLLELKTDIQYPPELSARKYDDISLLGFSRNNRKLYVLGNKKKTIYYVDLPNLY